MRILNKILKNRKITTACIIILISFIGLGIYSNSDFVKVNFVKNYFKDTDAIDYTVKMEDGIVIYAKYNITELLYDTVGAIEKMNLDECTRDLYKNKGYKHGVTYIILNSEGEEIFWMEGSLR